MTEYTIKQIEETDENYCEPEKARALAAFLEIDPENVIDEIDEQSTSNEFGANGGDYLVVTDDEADVLWDEALDSYLDDCVLPEVPENMQMYFDRDAWKSDARMDGRGHSLSPYDGDEGDGTDPVNGEYFVIFRTN